MASDDTELRREFTRQGLRPTQWSNGPDAVYGEHQHPYGKVLVVTSGSMTLRIDGGARVVTLKRGDRLELPPQTPHSAVVGPEGVVCLEAHIRPQRERR